MAELYTKLKRYDEAEKVLKETLVNPSTDPKKWGNLFVIYDIIFSPSLPLSLYLFFSIYLFIDTSSHPLPFLLYYIHIHIYIYVHISWQSVDTSFKYIAFFFFMPTIIILILLILILLINRWVLWYRITMKLQERQLPLSPFPTSPMDNSSTSTTQIQYASIYLSLYIYILTLLSPAIYLPISSTLSSRRYSILGSHTYKMKQESC